MDGCEQGTSLEDALTLMRRNGALKAMVVKFDCGFNDWFSYRDIYEIYKIEKFLRLSEPFSNNKILPVKKALSENQPVVIGMHIVKSFFKIQSDGQFKPTEEERNHVFTQSFFELDPEIRTGS